MKNKSFDLTRQYIVLISLIMIITSQTTNAQEDESNFRPLNTFRSHLFFGGSFGLQFGSVTLIEISPLVGYKVTPRLGIGISPTYKYYGYKDPYYPSSRLESNVFGGSIFARYLILDNIFVHTEYESLFFNTKVTGSPTYMKQFNSLFVGGGYRQHIGENAAMNLMVLWNLNDTPDSPYTNPVIRVGFTIGM